MSYAERLARLIYVLLWLGIATVLILVGRAFVSGRMPFETPVDARTGTAALLVATDAGTGCEYILTPWGGIMPRTGRDGHQLCPADPQAAPGQPGR